jgi:outer membrane protein assembly factor BamB
VDHLRRCLLAAFVVLILVTGVNAGPFMAPSSDWTQWGQNLQHQGVTAAEGQPLDAALADFVYDPFVTQEQTDFGGDLLVHYQVPLVHGDDIWMEVKSGTYTPLLPDGSNFVTHWNSQVWNERRLRLEHGQLVQRWNFESDWKPVPQPLAGWEPVFQAALVGDSVFIPGAGGTVFEVDQESGRVRTRFKPFGDAIDPNIYVAGPISADKAGNAYYSALKLNADLSTAGSWLVKIDRRGRIGKISFTDLVPDAPTSCIGTFSLDQLPWPPSPTAVPPSEPCGIQRAALNVAPAIAPDGMVYTVSRADINVRYGYLIAVRPDLTPKWAASFRDRLNDGCGVLLPIASDDTPQRNTCRKGTHVGVEPETNQPPTVEISDVSTSSPTVMPDGSILYGAISLYNHGRGHLLKFSPRGGFLAAYDFGWDITPSAFVGRDGREHVVIKDNQYDSSFCGPDPRVPVSQIVCALADHPGPHYVTQLDANLVPEWKFQNTNTESCHRLADGSLQCVSDHPYGFEWCVNAPAVDVNGTVYANSEDGRLYAIDQGQHGVFTKARQRLFLNLAVGAAYTPLSLLPNGLILTQNNGHLFVVGED